MVKHVNLAVNQNKAQLLRHLDRANRKQSKALSAGPVKAHRLTRSGWVVIWGRSIAEPQS